MVDKSKMTVAEMLAAARKADSKGGAPAEEASPAPAAEEAAAPEATEAPRPAPAAPAKPAAGGKMSTADILAMARAKKGDAAAAPAAKESPKPAPAPKPAAAKAAPAKKEAAAPAGPADTQSILAAARKSAQPGPMTKAEAAAKGVAVAPPPKKPVKETIVLPPMPVKPDYAKLPHERTKQEVAERRAFLFGISALAVGFTAMSGALALWTLGTVRFMFPNVLRLPPSRFKVGFPDGFAPGSVEEKFKAQFGVWIVNTEYNGEQQIFALKSVCTHLGCTPNWLEAEQKFKCPCHGSGFYKDGINFEGPAPRPLERYAISVANDGQIEVDKSKTFQEEMGQWADAASFIPA
ncbi:MAG: ubiquinol-cytochrome c reductase iron-sulfur subunit [Pirellulales bacterium]